MFRRTTAVLTAALVLGAVAAPAALANGRRDGERNGGKKPVGTVASFDGTTLTVTMNDGSSKTATTDEDTRVKIDHRGRPAAKGNPTRGSLEDLVAGALVLRMKTDDGALEKVRIRRAPAEAAPALAADCAEDAETEGDEADDAETEGDESEDADTEGDESASEGEQGDTEADEAQSEGDESDDADTEGDESEDADTEGDESDDCADDADDNADDADDADDAQEEGAEGEEEGSEGEEEGSAGQEEGSEGEESNPVDEVLEELPV